MPGETAFLRRLVAEIPPSPDVLVGPGDDAAILAGSNAPWAATTDTLVENVDFLPDFPAEAIGRRAIAVNLSDLAATGARPRAFLLTIGFPPERGEDFPLRVARGALSGAAGAALAGGDLSRSPVVFVSIALWGGLEGEPLRRSGARAGDLLYLSGWPGRAAAGLALAREPAGSGGRAGGLPGEQRDELLRAYRDPEPRLALGSALARERWATAAIDVSDGVGIDTGRLAEASNLRAVVDSDRLPIAAALAEFARRAGTDPVSLALSGGDDYELLFTVPPEVGARLPETAGGVPLTRIGRMETGRGAVLRTASADRDIAELGHDLFGGAP